MQVLVLTPYKYGTTAGPRSSFELWERVLRDAGITLTYRVFETDRLREVIYQQGHVPQKATEMARAYAQFATKVMRDIKPFDAVLINREATLIGPAAIERIVARRGKRLIYLLDDPLYIPYRSPANGWMSYLKFFGKVKALCRMSAAVIANSPSHAAFARRYNGNVWEIPSVVDAERYTGWQPAGRDNGRVCVGWTGSTTTAPNLQLIRKPLTAFARRPDTDLLFIGAAELGLPEVPHTALPWSAETEVDDLRRLDVGLLPLPNTKWSPHKFNLKLVQYMALGIPPVATPLGANPIVIEHGVNGFLADDDRQWQESVSRLIEHPDLREEMGRRAATTAQAGYTLQANTEKVIAAFRSIGVNQ